MADGSVTFKDASGTSRTHDTRSATNGDFRPVVAVGNDGDVVAGVEPFGALQVNNGYQTLFYDSWSTTLDTTDKWTVTGTAPTISGGNMTMAAGAGYHAIRTKDTVRPNSGFTYVANGVTLETTAATGSGRFFGLGTTATTPSATSLAQDGIGFEVDSATGALQAVYYVAGAKTVVATLPAGAAPTGTGANTATTVASFRDGQPHRFAMYFRVTSASWFVDNLQIPVATITFPPVTLVELPALISRFNAAFVGTPVFTNVAHLTADTSRPANSIGDATIGTRTAKVSSVGGLMAHMSEGHRVTYSASFDAVANVLATDIFVLTGPTSGVLRVTRIGIVAVSTAASNVRLNLVKRTGSYTGGTSATATVVPYDSAATAATATFRNYSVAATVLATLVGIVRSLRIPTAVPAGVTAPQELTFGDRASNQPVLRSATEHLALNAPVAPAAGATWTVDIEFTIDTA